MERSSCRVIKLEDGIGIWEAVTLFWMARFLAFNDVADRKAKEKAITTQRYWVKVDTARAPPSIHQSLAAIRAFVEEKYRKSYFLPEAPLWRLQIRCCVLLGGGIVSRNRTKQGKRGQNETLHRTARTYRVLAGGRKNAIKHNKQASTKYRACKMRISTNTRFLHSHGSSLVRFYFSF